MESTELLASGASGSNLLIRPSGDCHTTRSRLRRFYTQSVHLHSGMYFELPTYQDQKRVIQGGPTITSADCAIVSCMIGEFGVAEAITIAYVWFLASSAPGSRSESVRCFSDSPALWTRVWFLQL